MQSKLPLVLFLPWLRAPKSAVEKYVRLYEEFGFEVLCHHVQLIDFLLPSIGLKHSVEFLDKICVKLDPEKPIVIHSMSIGCYFYSLMLLSMQRYPQRFYDISSRIRAQVFDSPVVGTFQEMAHAVGEVTASNQLLKSVTKYSSLFYLRATYPFTLKYYNLALGIIRYQLPSVPILFIKAADDTMALPESVEELISGWRKHGLIVDYKIFEHSNHAQLLRTHPEHYKFVLYSYLNTTLPDSTKCLNKSNL